MKQRSEPADKIYQTKQVREKMLEPHNRMRKKNPKGKLGFEGKVSKSTWGI